MKYNYDCVICEILEDTKGFFVSGLNRSGSSASIPCHTLLSLAQTSNFSWDEPNEAGEFNSWTAPRLAQLQTNRTSEDRLRDKSQSLHGTN